MAGEEKMAGTASSKPLFRDLDPEDDEIEVTELESLCMNCHENVSQTLKLKLLQLDQTSACMVQII